MSCICQNCGNYYKIDLNVSDHHWQLIKPKSNNEGGLLCAPCIMGKLEEKLD